jgi:hypothetical protein
MQIDDRVVDVPQTSPGRYDVSVSAPREPAFVTLRHEGRAIDRIAVAGRYAPEFDSLGNDHDAMRRLAELSGGAVVWPTDHAKLNLPHPDRGVELTAWVAALGAIFLAMSLITLRRRGEV